jgi:hypothetical protein
MRVSVKSFLLGLVVASMTCFTGCMSVPEDTFKPSTELYLAAINFQLAEKRWPRDYEDLSDFLKRSHDPHYASLQAVKFHRLDFISLRDGDLKVDMDYTTASGDATVSDSFVMSVPQIIHTSK